MLKTRDLNLRIDRAKEHLGSLQAHIEAFLSQQPYVITGAIDPVSRRPTYSISSVTTTPDSLSISSGEVLQQLRSALDNLAYQLVASGTRSAGPYSHVYFPIAVSLASYQASKSAKTRGMTVAALAAIDTIQPFKGPSDALWELHQLNIIDKHRLLLTTGSAVRSVNLGAIVSQYMREFKFPETQDFPDLDLFVKPADRMCPLKPGDVIFTDAPDATLKNVQFKFEISFNEPSVLVNGPSVTEVLTQMITTVESVCQALEVFI